MKKQPEITEKTKQTFIHVFCELYIQKPIEKISIQEISNKAGYNRSTFYQYFTDIYELLDCVETNIMNYIHELSQNENCTTEASGSQSIVYLFEEKGNYLEALLGDYGSIRFLERLKKEILSDQPTSFAEKDSPLLPYLMEFQINTPISLFRLWQRRKKDLPSEELIELIQTLYNTAMKAYSSITETVDSSSTTILTK